MTSGISNDNIFLHVMRDAGGVLHLSGASLEDWLRLTMQLGRRREISVSSGVKFLSFLRI